MSVQHRDIDPDDGHCRHCGQSQEMIDDNIYPACEKFEGPHAVVLARLSWTLLVCDRVNEELHRKLAAADGVLADWLFRRLAQVQKEAQEIAATFEFLKHANEAALEAEIKAAHPVFVLEETTKLVSWRDIMARAEAKLSCGDTVEPHELRAFGGPMCLPEGEYPYVEAELARLRAAKPHVAECEGGNVIITTYHPDRPLDGYIPGKTWWDGEAWQPLPAR